MSDVVVREQPSKRGHATMYTLGVYGKDAADVMLKILPFMWSARRKKQITDALDVFFGNKLYEYPKK